MKRLIPLAALAALGGCASSTPTRFWTIEPAPPANSPASRQAVGPLRVDAVHVPLAIDRLEIVQHDTANRVTVNDFDRWSAPPGDLIQRALTQDLDARLPEGSVIFPESPKPAGTTGIVVDILDLRQTQDGYAMKVSWSATGSTPATATLHRQLDLRTSAAPSVAGETDALAQLVGQLADSIADTFTTTSDAR